MTGITSLRVERYFLHHAVAEECARRGLVTQWCGVVSHEALRQRLPPLRAPFSRIFSYREFLDLGGEPGPRDADELERRYHQPTLWRAIVPDRRLYTLGPTVYAHNPAFRGFDHEQILRLTVRAFRAAERLLDELRPGAVLIESAGAIDEYALHTVAQARGIPAFFINHSRIRNRWFLTQDPLCRSRPIDEEARALRRGEARPPSPDELAFARDVLEGIRSRQETPPANDTTIDWLRAAQAIRVARMLRFPLRAAQLFFADREGDPYAPDPWRLLADRVALRWRLARDRHFQKWMQPVGEEPYIYLPLQMQPEVTSSIWAPGYMDQVSLVELVARSIPVSWKVYVKEHPVMLGCRASGYYRRIRRLPNVRLLDPSLSSHRLTRGAELVGCVTGTAAWEAAAMGKKAIIFGPTSFADCRGVLRFSGGPGELAAFVRHVVDQDAPGAFDPTDYLVAVQRHTFAGDHIAIVDSPELVDQQEVSVVVDRITELLEDPEAYRWVDRAQAPAPMPAPTLEEHDAPMAERT